MHSPEKYKHIVQFHHTENPHDRNNLMLEYLEGETLGETLGALETKYKSFIDDKIIENIKRKIQEIVNHIHSKSYAHGDIKQDNIMFRKKIVDPSIYDWVNNIVFIDFGEAKYISPVFGIEVIDNLDKGMLTELKNYLDELKS